MSNHLETSHLDSAQEQQEYDREHERHLDGHGSKPSGIFLQFHIFCLKSQESKVE
jgi:hypothetical protein